MAFKDFPEQQQGVQVLQRSLERGRLAHAYLFTGHDLEELESLARALAQTLNCQRPLKRGGVAIDCCGQCSACQRIEHGNHPDVHWLRPESKSRIIKVSEVRELIREINLKTTEAEFKVAVIVAADRLKTEGANAFLKTLEEPPAKSVLILLSTEPQRLLETILSRCLRLNFEGKGPRQLPPAQMEWLKSFSDMAAAEQKSLLGRYRVLDTLLGQLEAMRTAIEENLRARSPAEQHEEVEGDLAEKWEKELDAAIDAEYRRQRADLLAVLQWWLRDVWLQTLKSKVPAGEPASGEDGLLSFPQLAGTGEVARRISDRAALENLQILEQLQRRLHTNVQEALALEVSLLKLQL